MRYSVTPVRSMPCQRRATLLPAGLCSGTSTKTICALRIRPGSFSLLTADHRMHAFLDPLGRSFYCLSPTLDLHCRLRCQQLSGQLQALKAEVDRASEAPASKQGFDLLLRCSKTRKDLEVGLAQQQRCGTCTHMCKHVDSNCHCQMCRRVCGRPLELPASQHEQLQCAAGRQASFLWHAVLAPKSPRHLGIALP